MIHIINHQDIPKYVGVACSGGVDSMALVDFLIRGFKYVDILFFHHGTETSEKAYHFLIDYCDSQGLNLYTTKLEETKPKNRSQEEFWRIQRYDFFKSYHEETGRKVLTAHHLNDCVETWIFSSCHGEGRLIPYMNDYILRPLLLNEKSSLIDWCTRKNVPWQEDLSNNDTKYMRNHIRHNVMPEILKINPGIHTTIKKKVLTNYCQTVQ